MGLDSTKIYIGNRGAFKAVNKSVYDRKIDFLSSLSKQSAPFSQHKMKTATCDGCLECLGMEIADRKGGGIISLEKIAFA